MKNLVVWNWLWRTLALALMAVPCSPSTVRADAVVLNADSDLEHVLDETVKDLRAGQIDRSLNRLMQTHEEAWGKNRLVRSRGQLQPGATQATEAQAAAAQAARIHIPFTVAVRTLLVELSSQGFGPEPAAGDHRPTLRQLFRARFDAAATALYQRGRADRDIRRLRRCAELYPLCEVGFEAGLLAGDLHLERGQLTAATEVWAELEALVSGRGEIQALASRWVLVAQRSGDTELYDTWAKRLAEGTPVPASPSARAAQERAAITYGSYRKVWESFPDFNKRPSAIYMGMANLPHYIQVPAIGDDWVAVTTVKNLTLLRRDGGKTIQQFKFPRVYQAPPDSYHLPFADYYETDRNLRLEPGHGGGVVVTSYVDWANKTSDYQRYIIEQCIPRRGLKAFAVERRRELWDTRHLDVAMLGELNFNSTPIVDQDRVYALAWRKAGFIETHLVCLQRDTGALLWRTPLVGNQIDLTMFGEINSEPMPGAPLLRDGVLYLCTNLGACAAVRAYDGRVQWISPYQSLPVAPPTQYPSRRTREQDWEPGPVLVSQDRLVAAPLDAGNSYSFHAVTGRLLLSEPAPRSRQPRLVGLHGKELVYCDHNQVWLVPALDITAAGRQFSLQGSINAAPGLARGGLVYATEVGLYYQPFVDGAPARLLVGFETGKRRSSRAREELQDGHVTVLEDMILVSNSYKVYAFVGVPDPQPR